VRLAWHWCSALGTCITVFNIYKTNDFNIHYHHLYHITTLQWRNLPDTGGPSETYETSRSSEGLVAAGDIGASGDSARHGCSYNNAPLAPLTITRTDDDYSSSLIWITLLHDISTATILWTCMPRMQKDYHTFVSTAEFKVKKAKKTIKDMDRCYQQWSQWQDISLVDAVQARQGQRSWRTLLKCWSCQTVSSIWYDK